MNNELTLERAIEICTKCYLNVDFRFDLDAKYKGKNYRSVVICPNAWTRYEADTFLEAMGLYVAENQWAIDNMEKEDD